jgi:hypothetical protein
LSKWPESIKKKNLQEILETHSFFLIEKLKMKTIHPNDSLTCSSFWFWNMYIECRCRSSLLFPLKKRTMKRFKCFIHGKHPIQGCLLLFFFSCSRVSFMLFLFFIFNRQLPLVIIDIFYQFFFLGNKNQ